MSNFNVNKEALNQVVARKIIETVGGQGIPPEFGFQYFTVGLDDYLKTIENEYLSSFIREGGSSFKLVIGNYGSGKTHFLYCIRALAWKYNFVVSYVVLSPEHSPFYALERIYKEIVANLAYPQGSEELIKGYKRGIESLIRLWYLNKYNELKEKTEKSSEGSIWEGLINYASSLGLYESTSFRNAMKEAFLSTAEKRYDDLSLVVQWLKGENPPKDLIKRYGIFERIDKSTAFKMIRSLAQWIRDIGFSGIVVLFDEAEQIPSMSSKQAGLLLNNLRELIDECGQDNFKNTMWFYAIPDENFLEGRTLVYEALRQRTATVFNSKLNPTGVKIYLEKIPSESIENLKEIGRRLAKIYEVAYGIKFNEHDLETTLEEISQAVYEKKFEVGYKRLFVQSIVKAFHIMRQTRKPVSRKEVEL